MHLYIYIYICAFIYEILRLQSQCWLCALWAPVLLLFIIAFIHAKRERGRVCTNMYVSPSNHDMQHVTQPRPTWKKWDGSMSTLCGFNTLAYMWVWTVAEWSEQDCPHPLWRHERIAVCRPCCWSRTCARKLCMPNSPVACRPYGYQSRLDKLYVLPMCIA